MIALATLVCMAVSATKFPTWLYVMVFLAGIRVTRKTK